MNNFISIISGKIEQLKNLNKKAREEGNVVQSPFYNDEVNNPCIKVNTSDFKVIFV